MITQKKETCQEMQTRHQKEVDNFEGMFFAFNNRQLEEGLIKVGLSKTDTDKIVSIGSGGFIRKDRKEAFFAMFDRFAQEREDKRKNEKTIDIRFYGIDGFNRPVFRTVKRPYRYYGSVHALFDADATEEKVLSALDEDGLCYFGRSFGCEPSGTNSGNIKIQRKGRAAL